VLIFHAIARHADGDRLVREARVAAKHAWEGWPGAHVLLVPVKSRTQVFTWLAIAPAPIHRVLLIAWGDAYHAEFDASPKARLRAVDRARRLILMPSPLAIDSAIVDEERWVAGFLRRPEARHSAASVARRHSPGATWQFSLVAVPQLPAGALGGPDPESAAYRRLLLPAAEGTLRDEVASELGVPCSLGVRASVDDPVCWDTSGQSERIGP
jgi:hypothetical protein